MANTPTAAIPNRVALSAGIGQLGLYLYAFTSWLSPQLHLVGLAMCGIALVMVPVALRRIAKTRAFIVWLAIALYLFVQSLWGNHLVPGSLDAQLRETARWLGCGSFLIIGWWFKGNPRIIRNSLVLALAGLCVGIIHSAGLTALLTFQTGKQTGFHLTASTAGLLAATALLGLLLTPPSLARTHSGRVGHLLKSLAWCTAMYLMAYLLVASQSRATWIAALIVIPLTLRLRKIRSQSHQKKGRLPGPGWLVLLIILIGIGLNRHMVLERIAPDLAVVMSLLESDPTNKNNTPSSLGYRLKAQQFGLAKWREHPWVGWGPASTGHLISESRRPDLWNEAKGNWLTHTHNGYLEILIRYGLLGSLIIFSCSIILLRYHINARPRNKILPSQLSWLISGSFSMLIIWNAGVFQMTTPAWQTYLTFIFSSYFSASLFPTVKDPTK